MKKPTKVLVSGKIFAQKQGWDWQVLDKGGVLKIGYQSGNSIKVTK
jgi:hypothetical protein